MELITVKDKTFRISIPEAEIQASIKALAAKINTDLEGEVPLFLCVLNGSFMFAGDLMKYVSIDCEISFVKLASYHGGMESSGAVKQLIGLNTDISNRTVVIVEDIVDTGNTIEALTQQLQALKPKQVRVATLLFKPEAYQKSIPIDYAALEVPNLFLVGYGLDYDELGRNLKDIYVLHQPE